MCHEDRNKAFLETLGQKTSNLRAQECAAAQIRWGYSSHRTAQGISGVSAPEKLWGLRDIMDQSRNRPHARIVPSPLSNVLSLGLCICPSFLTTFIELFIMPKEKKVSKLILWGIWTSTSSLKVHQKIAPRLETRLQIKQWDRTSFENQLSKASEATLSFPALSSSPGCGPSKDWSQEQRTFQFRKIMTQDSRKLKLWGQYKSNLVSRKE